MSLHVLQVGRWCDWTCVLFCACVVQCPYPLLSPQLSSLFIKRPTRQQSQTPAKRTATPLPSAPPSPFSPGSERSPSPCFAAMKGNNGPAFTQTFPSFRKFQADKSFTVEASSSIGHVVARQNGDVQPSSIEISAGTRTTRLDSGVGASESSSSLDVERWLANADLDVANLRTTCMSSTSGSQLQPETIPGTGNEDPTWFLCNSFHHE